MERGGKYVRPKGFKEVVSLNSSEYPLAGFIIESSEEIIVAFRGTELLIDVLMDLDWFQRTYPFVPDSGKVDNGFLRDYRSIRSKAIDTLKMLPSNKRLYITGHSLGGAAATLAALDVAANTDFKQPNVYTYASPRVGNSEFVDAYNSAIEHSIRVANINDIIPHLPPPAIPLLHLEYRHVAERYPIQFQTFSIRRNHEIEYYFRRLCSKFETTCKQVCCDNPKLCPPVNKEGALLCIRKS